MRNRRKDDDLCFGVELAACVGDELFETRFERIQPRRTGERLVQPEHCQQNIGLVIAEVVAVVGEVGTARSQIDLVGRPAQIADDQFFVRKAALQQSLEVSVVLHPLGQRVANDHDFVARIDGHPRRLGQ